MSYQLLRASSSQRKRDVEEPAVPADCLVACIDCLWLLGSDTQTRRQTSHTTSTSLRTRRGGSLTVLAPLLSIMAYWLTPGTCYPHDYQRWEAPPEEGTTGSGKNPRLRHGSGWDMAPLAIESGRGMLLCGGHPCRYFDPLSSACITLCTLTRNGSGTLTGGQRPSRTEKRLHAQG